MGLEYARQLAGKGYDLILVSNREDELAAASEDLSKAFPVKIVTHFQDLALTDSADSLFDWCVNDLTEDALDPTGPNDNPGTGKVRRGSSYAQGGTWQSFAASSHRNYGARNEKQGFRICAPVAIPAFAE